MNITSVLKLLVFIVTINLLASFPASAEIAIELTMDESFGMGDQISFEYSIVSDETQTIYYTIFIKCPQAPIPLFEIKTVDLKEDEPLVDTYIYLTVDEYIEPQTCTAEVCIISGEMEMTEQPEIIQKEEVEFIIDVPPSFEFYPITCRDEACSDKTQVFILSETMYLDYESELPEVSVSGLLTRPDTSTQKLTLPATEPASQIGTYELKVEASKESYKTMKGDSIFAVIEERIEIPSGVVCVVDGVCDKGETLKSCPQDCAQADFDNDGVPNYQDKCPDTHQGRKVDEEGCSFLQRIAKARLKLLVRTLNGIIQGLPDRVFDKNPEQRKEALSEELDLVLNLVDNGNYQGAINKLSSIKARMVGCIGGNSEDDWIVSCFAQRILTRIINRIIAGLD